MTRRRRQSPPVVAVVVRPDNLRSRRADVALAAAGQLHDRLVAARRDGSLPRCSSTIPEPVGVGSVLLVPETLTRPTRDGRDEEIDALAFLLARLDLRPVDLATAELAAALGAEHHLRAADAVHLATPVIVGADRFITNNHRDFDRATVSQLAVTYPDDLDGSGR